MCVCVIVKQFYQQQNKIVEKFPDFILKISISDVYRKISKESIFSLRLSPVRDGFLSVDRRVVSFW